MAQILGPCTPLGDQEEAPGSWLRIGTVCQPQCTGRSSHLGGGGVNQRKKEDLSLCLSSLSLTV